MKVKELVVVVEVVVVVVVLVVLVPVLVLEALLDELQPCNQLLLSPSILDLIRCPQLNALQHCQTVAAGPSDESCKVFPHLGCPKKLSESYNYYFVGGVYFKNDGWKGGDNINKYYIYIYIYYL